MSEGQSMLTVSDSGMSHGRVMDVFGDWINPDDIPPPPPPCKTIAITAEMRALDAAKRAEREAAKVSVWPIKAELSVDNLRMVKRRPQPGRVMESRLATARPRAAKAPPTDRLCGCGEKLQSRQRKYCTACCVNARAEKRGRQNESKRDKRAKVRAVRRLCANGCGTRLAPATKGDICARCVQRPNRSQEKPRCANFETCGRTIHVGALQRPDRLCKLCARAVLQRALRERKRKSCGVCGVSISLRAKHCRLHIGGKVGLVCSKCGGPRDRKGNGFCRKCHNEYMKARNVRLRAERAEENLKSKESDVMKKQEGEKRPCGVLACEKLVGVHNKSGRCAKHFAVKIGTPMRDGSTWAGSGAAAAKTQGGTARKPSRAAVEVTTRAGGGRAQVAELVMLPVSAAMLDAFWTRLELVDKVRIVAAEMAR